MKKTAFILLILVLALLAVTAGAEGPKNPSRHAAVEAERLAQQLHAQRISGEGSVEANNSQRGLKVTCKKKPAMNGTGSWTIALVGHNASQVKRMICYLGCKDYSNEYTHVHWIEKDRDAGDTNPFMSTYTTPKIVTSGNYQVFFYIVYKDGSIAWYEQDYTVSGTNALQNKIKSVAASCKADTKWQTALNLHEWLTKNLYYDHSLQYYGADSILRGYGVCDSYSKIYMMLCKAAGIPVSRVTNNDHAWNAIKLGGEWFYVDCTWDDPGSAKKKTSGSETQTYFGLNDELLGLDHPKPWSWTGASKQKCTSLSANYYIHTGLWKEWRYDDYKGLIISYIENNGLGVCSVPNIYNSEYMRLCMEYGFRKTAITLPDSNKIKIDVSYVRGDDAFYFWVTGWSAQENGTLKLPAKLKDISDEDFAGCSATTLEIPSGCVSIGSGAFRNSKIRTVIIPDTVTEIAADAFSGCGRIIFKTVSQAAFQYVADHPGSIVTVP